MSGTSEATLVASVALGLTTAVPTLGRLVVSEPKIVLSIETRPSMTAEFDPSVGRALPVTVGTDRVVWAGGLSSEDRMLGTIVRPGTPSRFGSCSWGSPLSTWRWTCWKAGVVRVSWLPETWLEARLRRRRRADR